jgi:hypothetical protein
MITNIIRQSPAGENAKTKKFHELSYDDLQYQDSFIVDHYDHLKHLKAYEKFYSPLLGYDLQLYHLGRSG